MDRLHTTSRSLTSALLSQKNPTKAAVFKSFFKAGKGQYAEGDRFLGLTVPQVRTECRGARSLSLLEIRTLLKSQWHEVRLAALILLVNHYQKAAKKNDTQSLTELHVLYLKNIEHVNHWDLVDLSARFLIGDYLFRNPSKLSLLKKLARSSSLWERRCAILATFPFIHSGQFSQIFWLTDQLSSDPQPLLHKALGWLLREVGKVDKKALLEFLEPRFEDLPSVLRSYATEKLTSQEKARLRKTKM